MQRGPTVKAAWVLAVLLAAVASVEVAVAQVEGGGAVAEERAADGAGERGGEGVGARVAAEWEAWGDRARAEDGDGHAQDADDGQGIEEGEARGEFRHADTEEPVEVVGVQDDGDAAWREGVATAPLAEGQVPKADEETPEADARASEADYPMPEAEVPAQEAKVEVPEAEATDDESMTGGMVEEVAEAVGGEEARGNVDPLVESRVQEGEDAADMNARLATLEAIARDQRAALESERRETAAALQRVAELEAREKAYSSAAPSPLPRQGRMGRRGLEDVGSDAEVEAARQRVRELEEEVKLLRDIPAPGTSAAKDKRIRVLEMQLEAVNSMGDTLSARDERIRGLEMEIASAERRIRDLESAPGSGGKGDKDMQALENQLNAERQNREGKEKRIDVLEAMMTQQEQEYVRRIEELESLTTQSGGLHEEVAALQRSLTYKEKDMRSLNEALSEAYERLATKERAVLDLELQLAQVATRAGEVETPDAAVAELEAKVADLERQKIELAKSSAEAREAAISDMKEQVRALESEIQILGEKHKNDCADSAALQAAIGEAEKRRQEAEEHARIAEERSKTLSDLRAQVSAFPAGGAPDAVRVAQMEGELRMVNERARLADDRALEAEVKVAAAERRAEEAESKVAHAENLARAMEEKSSLAQEKARVAEEMAKAKEEGAAEKVREAEAKFAEAETRKLVAEQSLSEAMRRVETAESVVKEAEKRAKEDQTCSVRNAEVDERARVAEERLAAAEAAKVAAEARTSTAEAAKVVAEGALSEALRRAENAESNARVSDAQMQKSLAEMNAQFAEREVHEAQLAEVAARADEAEAQYTKCAKMLEDITALAFAYEERFNVSISAAGLNETDAGAIFAQWVGEMLAGSDYALARIRPLFRAYSRSKLREGREILLHARSEAVRHLAAAREDPAKFSVDAASHFRALVQSAWATVQTPEFRARAEKVAADLVTYARQVWDVILWPVVDVFIGIHRPSVQLILDHRKGELSADIPTDEIVWAYTHVIVFGCALLLAVLNLLLALLTAPFHRKEATAHAGPREDVPSDSDGAGVGR